jgi:PKD repeat protein
MTSISFTITTTTNYQVLTGGTLQVNFNSVQVDTTPPQAYSFGVEAQTSPGLWITRLHWEFGDGSILDVPYCCQNEVSEVQYHAYSQPGSYTVVVVAYDNAGNFGDTLVTVNWVQPLPEYPAPGLPLLMSVFAVLIIATYAKDKRPFRKPD